MEKSRLMNEEIHISRYCYDFFLYDPDKVIILLVFWLILRMISLYGCSLSFVVNFNFNNTIIHFCVFVALRLMYMTFVDRLACCPII